MSGTRTRYIVPGLSQGQVETIVEGDSLALPLIRATGYMALCYGKIDAAQPGSGTLAGDKLHATEFVELRRNMIYDALIVDITTAVAATNGRLGLYAPDANGLPGALLWSATGIDTTGTGTKTVTFLSGTWTAAGAAYKDGSSRFVPELASQFWLAWVGQNGNVGLHTLGNSTSISRGIDESNLGVAHMTGVTKDSVSGALPDPFGSPTVITTGVPLIVLRFV